jgi:hypothetical protein
MASYESQQNEAEALPGDHSHPHHHPLHLHSHHSLHEAESDQHRISQVILHSVNDLRAELSQKLNEVKELIDTTRCRCGDSKQLLPTDQVTELKELIRSGSCHCSQNEH